MKSNLRFLLLSTAVAFSFSTFSQVGCPTYVRRNNANNPNATCGSTTGLPQASNGQFWVKTGQFEFSGETANLTRNKVFKNGTLYQDGTLLLPNNNLWFGDYVGGNDKQICFYAEGGNINAPPAANWTFEFQSGSTTLTCSYNLTGTNTISTFSPGTISADQIICSGTSVSTLSSTADASSCSSGAISYQWQSSITSSTTNFSDITVGSFNLNTYSPGSITQTTFYKRIATCSGDGSTTNSNVVTITVNSAGTISPSAGYTWDASTTSPTFTITGATSGGTGTWSSSNTGVATIGSSSGVLSAVSAGTSIITYSLFAGGITCTTTRNITITGTPGALPVTWQAVVAEKLSDRVLVRWTTAAELNTRDFEVQFSTNATDWHPVGTVPAAGKSESPRDYSFLHQSPQKGGVHNFYRILQRDLDGTSSYSKIVSIIMDAPGPDVMIFPNPASHILTLYLAESQLLRLVNTSGATVWQAKLPAGRHQLPVTHLSKGVYLMLTNQGPKRVVIQ